MTILKKGHNLPIRQAQSPHEKGAPPPPYQDSRSLSAYCEDVPENPKLPASGPLQPLLESPVKEARSECIGVAPSAAKGYGSEMAAESASQPPDDYEAQLNAFQSSLVGNLASLLSDQVDKFTRLITAREATESLYPTEDLQSVYRAAKPKYEHSVRAIREALARLDPNKPDTILGASSCVETLTKTGAELLIDAVREVHLYADYICEGRTRRERQIRAKAYIEHKRKTSEIYGPSEDKDTEVPMVVAIFKERFPDEIETAKLLESTFPARETTDLDDDSTSNTASSFSYSQNSQ